MSPPVPRPGRPARGTESGRPIMVLLDLLGRRWTLRILWELRDGAALTFRGLQEAGGGISPSVLRDRLRELIESGIVARGAGYELTPEGEELLAQLVGLQDWAESWAARRRDG